MTDCSCKALGYRLRAIETGESQRTNIPFDIPDWFPVDGYYVIDIPASLHLKGINPEIQIEILEGGVHKAIDLDDLIINAAGDTRLQVVRVPDGRFQGRAIFM